MSYDFTNDHMIGDFTTLIDVSATGCTIACWLKQADHTASDYALSLSIDTDLDDACCLVTGAADAYRAAAIKSGTAGADYSASTNEYDGVWFPWVGVYTSDTSRDVYVELIGNKGSNTTSKDTGSMGHIVVGAAPNTFGDLNPGSLAEIAIWNTALSTADITSYLGGTAASGINPTKLRGYWPLDYDNSTQSNTDGLDATGDLTVTGAVYNADHPTITSGTSIPIFQNYYRQRRA